ncbi:MAG: peptide chain release factor N(5)-glutamine methyltransferase [Paracoccaceae bacterium]
MSEDIRAGLSGSRALVIAGARLKVAGVDTPGRDARKLLAYALKSSVDHLTLVLPEPLSAADAARFVQAIKDRAKRKPVSLITGTRAFFGHEFTVTADVLDPRPETETLVTAALRENFENLLDLGCGSGCILLSLLAERPGARGLGVDVSARAIAVARDNAQRLGLSARASFARSDWLSAVDGRFDLIVANPPYISAPQMRDLEPEVALWDPEIALNGGADGLAAYRAIIAQLSHRLPARGRFMVETGPSQSGAVSAMMAGAGFGDIAVTQDLDGRDRVVTGYRIANSAA